MPDDTLSVHLNREDLHAVEVPPSFEATGSFDVALVNHGASVHAHLHLDDDLSEVAAIDAANHFVDGESQRVVRVSVNGTGPVSGKLKVASAYGAETRWVDVHIVEPEDEEQSVEVDESLAEPQPRRGGADDSGSSLSALVANPELIVLVLGVSAVLVAAIAALVIDNLLVLLGALVVLVGVLVAMYFLVAGS